MHVMEVDEIMSLMPHRYPSLLVDRVDELVPDKTIECTKNVTVNEKYFQGHFPGTPIMPGVLIIEALAQAALILLLKSEKFSTSSPALRSIDRAKFRQLVKPGDTLKLQANIKDESDASVKVKCAAMVGEDIACSAALTFAIPD